jgi:15-cis-phytoene synthase
VNDTGSQLSAIVRAGDPDRYLADLFAPAEHRRHLFALHAFAIEVASIRWKVSDPTLGEIRLRWWEAALRGDHGGSPVAAALADTIVIFDLPLTAFDQLLQARIFDLYDDPMPSLNDLEGYAGDTWSSLMQLGAIILAGGRDPHTAELSGLAGVAAGLADVLRRLPRNAAAGQPFLPQDVLLRHGAAGRLAAPAGPELRSAHSELRTLARTRLAEARRAADCLDPALLPAFLPAATVELYLDRMESPSFDPLRDIADIAPVRRQWALWRAARKGTL